MDLFNLIKEAQNGNKNAIYEIIQDFDKTLTRLSNGLHYEEGRTDLIIELIRLIKYINLSKFRNSNNRQIAKYIHIHLNNRFLDLVQKKQI